MKIFHIAILNILVQKLYHQLLNIMNSIKLPNKNIINYLNIFVIKLDLILMYTIIMFIYRYIFWIGITVHDNVINMKIKRILYDKIKDWKNNGPPSGIHLEKSRNRWKFFIMYKYFYRLKNMTTAQINKANSIAGGLRHIKNSHFPIWVKKLINYLKNIHFIPQQFID